MVQVKARDELLKGRERETKQAQVIKQQAAQRVADLKKQEEKLYALNLGRKEVSKRLSMQLAEEKLRQQTQVHKLSIYQESRRKQDMVRKERERYENSLARFLKRNRYRTDMLSYIPYRVIYNMSPDALVSFYSAKPNDLAKAVDCLFQGSRIYCPQGTDNPDDFCTIDEAARAIHQKLHAMDSTEVDKLLCEEGA